MTLFEYFKKQVEQDPNALCLSSAVASGSTDQKVLTRAEVWQQVCQLANYLVIHKNIKKGDVVGIVLDHSIQSVITILAINMARAVFLPLNKSRPIEAKKAALLNQASLILVDDQIDTGNIEQLNIKHECSKISLQSTHEPKLEPIEARDPIYIAVTSGSTGEPKSMKLINSGLEFWAKEKPKHYTRLTKNSRFAMFSPIFYDAGHVPILLMGIFGCQLVIPSSDILYSPEMLREFLLNYKITASLFVPQIWQKNNIVSILKPLLKNGMEHFELTGDAFDTILVDTITNIALEEDLNLFKSLNLLEDLKIYFADKIFTAANSVDCYSPDILEQFRQLNRYILNQENAEHILTSIDLNILKLILNKFELGLLIAELQNLYGPTENVYGFSVRRVHPQEIQNGNVPIGVCKTAGSKIIIAKPDDNKNWIAVKPGEPGIGIIVSDHLTTGYDHDEKSNKSAFVYVKDPDSGQLVRGFNTTDEIVYNSESDLYYCLGRTSLTLFKINGVKVDAKGPEALLRKKPGIKQAIVVLPNEIKNTKPALKIFLEMEPDYPILNMSDIKKYLSECGYEYHHFFGYKEEIMFEHYALDSGKINRLALIKKPLTDLDKSREVLGPSNELEKKLLAAWQLVFPDNEEVSTNDVFQRIGGDSQLFMQLMGHLTKTFGRIYTYKDFQDIELTISKMAVVILKEQILANIDPKTQLPKFITVLGETKADAPIYYMPGVTGQLSPEEKLLLEKIHATSKRPVLIFEDPAYFNEDTNLSIVDKASLYVEIISRVQPHGELTLLGYSSGVYDTWAMINLLEKNNRTFAMVGLIDEEAPLPDTIRKPVELDGVNANLQKLIKLANKLISMVDKHAVLPEWDIKSLSKLTIAEQTKIVCDILEEKLASNQSLSRVVQHNLLALAEFINNKIPLIKVQPNVYVSEETRFELSQHLLPKDSFVLDSLGWFLYQERKQVSSVIGGFPDTNHFSLLLDEHFQECLLSNIHTRKQTPESTHNDDLAQKVEDLSARLEAAQKAFAEERKRERAEFASTVSAALNNFMYTLTHNLAGGQIQGNDREPPNSCITPFRNATTSKQQGELSASLSEVNHQGNANALKF